MRKVLRGKEILVRFLQNFIDKLILFLIKQKKKLGRGTDVDQETYNYFLNIIEMLRSQDDPKILEEKGDIFLSFSHKF